MSIEGVKGPTKLVGKHDFEVRCDGFGTMTDIAVQNYKDLRGERYWKTLYENIKERITAIEEELHDTD